MTGAGRNRSLNYSYRNNMIKRSEYAPSSLESIRSELRDHEYAYIHDMIKHVIGAEDHEKRRQSRNGDMKWRENGKRQAEFVLDTGSMEEVLVIWLKYLTNEFENDNLYKNS